MQLISSKQPSRGFVAEFYPALLIISLAASCILISRKKDFWIDELFSHYVLAEPSFTAMWSAYADRINNAPPTWFVTGWVWASAFGAGELSLRLFSFTGMAVAITCTWLALRRSNSWIIAAVAVGAVFGLTDAILEQNAEARMYGLFIGLASAASWRFIVDETRPRPSALSLASSAGVHALLVNCHLFGLFYSLAIAAALAWGDTQRGRWSRAPLLAIMAGQVTLIAYIPAFFAQADAGTPRAWIPSPTLGDLITFFSGATSFAGVVLALAIAARVALGIGRRLCNASVTRIDGKVLDIRRADIRLAVIFLLVPPGIWLISLSVRPIFIDRYMLPSLIGVAIILAALLSEIMALSDIKVRRSLTAIMTIIAGAALIYPVAYARQRIPWPYHGQQDTQAGYGALPIVVPSSHTFLPRMYYAPEALRARYVFLLDWSAAIAPQSGTFPAQEHKHLETLRARWPERFSPAVIEADTFLACNREFLVAMPARRIGATCLPPKPWWSLRTSLDWENSIFCPQVLERHVFSRPSYRVEKLPRLPDGSEMLLVRRFETSGTSRALPGCAERADPGPLQHLDLLGEAVRIPVLQK